MSKVAVGCSDAEVEDNGRLDRNPADGRIVLELDTSGWPPGVHHFRLDVLRRRDKAVDYRTFALKVVGPRPCGRQCCPSSTRAHRTPPTPPTGPPSLSSVRAGAGNC